MSRHSRPDRSGHAKRWSRGAADELVERTQLVLNATPARREVRTGLADSVKMTLLNTYLRTSKQFHQVIVAAPTRKFNEERPMFEKIAASVQCDCARGNP